MAENGGKGLTDSVGFLRVLRVMAHLRDWLLSGVVTMLAGFVFFALWMSISLPIPFEASFVFIARQWLMFLPWWFVSSVLVMAALAVLVLLGWMMDVVSMRLRRGAMAAARRRWPDDMELFDIWLKSNSSRNFRSWPAKSAVCLVVGGLVIWMLGNGYPRGTIGVFVVTGILLLVSSVLALRELAKLRRAYRGREER